MRKLMRTLQSELAFLKGAKETCRRQHRKILRRPSDPDFASLRFIPDSLPGCYADVGANQGQSIEAILLFKPGARVHSFEPNPSLAAMLKKRYQGHPRIFIHGYGLADAARSAPLYTPVYKGYVYDGLASLDRQSAAGWLSSNTLYRFQAKRLELRENVCRTKRLDDEGLDPIFIKVDVQGYEHEVVQGGLQTIRHYQPVLMIEDLFHQPRLHTLLNRLGYKQYQFDTAGFYRADNSKVVNSLLMTNARAATVTCSAARAKPRHPSARR